MTTALIPARRALLRPVTWLLGAVLIAWVHLARIPGMAVENCVSPPSGLSWLGVHVSLLRESSACASGYAIGQTQGQVLGLVVMIALPILFANLAVAAATVGGVRYFGTLLAMVWTLAGAFLRSIPVLARGMDVRGRGRRVWREPARPLPAQWGRTLLGRAPPSALPA